MSAHGDLPTAVGAMVIGGFRGATLSARYAEALRAGQRGGAVLFRRNLPSVHAAHELCGAMRELAPQGMPPLIGVDEEGGRVSRLPSPALRLPSMRRLACAGPAMVERAAEVIGSELAAIGFTINFAPVLDVNTEESNPVIGDRAFGADPVTVADHGQAYVRGLRRAGVLSCGKHFPGHGATLVDSHHALPRVDRSREQLDAVDLVPFRAAIAAGVDALMSAHVVYESLQRDVPATLSQAIGTTLLRAELGFEGVLFSDDLEMKAIAAHGSIAAAAVRAVRAGCDALLVCSDEDAQDRVWERLVEEAERDEAFALRCREAVARLSRMRSGISVRAAQGGAELDRRVGAAAAQELAAELAELSGP